MWAQFYVRDWNFRPMQQIYVPPTADETMVPRLAVGAGAAVVVWSGVYTSELTMRMTRATPAVSAVWSPTVDLAGYNWSGFLQIAADDVGNGFAAFVLGPTGTRLTVGRFDPQTGKGERSSFGTEALAGVDDALAPDRKLA